MRHTLTVVCAALGALLLLDQCSFACDKHPVHFTTKQMSERIMRRTPIVPQANVARITGSIEMFLEVGAEGQPSCISVGRGHPILTTAAVNSVKDWRFRPYRVKGKLVTYSGSLLIDAKEFVDGHPPE